MRRSRHGRASTSRGPGRRVVVAVATLAAFGGLVGVTQISRAETESPAPAPTNSGSSQSNGLQILGDTCDDSDLQAHTGFQDGNRCVSTAFGEVGAAEQNPTLLITEAPETVRPGEPFQLRVSTRNLVRDRFLGAAAGGYYLESAFLTEQGLTRGHFHTACRMLTSTDKAVDPAPVPAFFVATEDGQGGAEPDTVTIQVPGLPQAGIAQCASWAGDGSHRIPMMQRANQIPAFDSVRIVVRADDEEPPTGAPPADESPAQEPTAEEPPAQEQPGQQQPPAGEPPVEQPGGQQPPAGEPPAQQPGQDEPGQDAPGQNTPGKEPSQQNPDGGQKPEPSSAPEAPNGDEAEPPASNDDDSEPTATTPPPAQAGSGAGDGNQSDDALADDSGGRLAFTGVNTIVLTAAGLLLIVAGIVITYLTRQRRYRTARH